MGASQPTPAPGMRGVRVRVSALDIQKGHAGDCSYCPVALAVKRHLNSAFDVQVGTCTVEVHDAASMKASILAGAIPVPLDIVRLPDKARKFIYGFDGRRGGGPVKPFSFNLPLPEVALRRQKPAAGAEAVRS